MQKCPSCGFNNRPGVVFCENCGTSLLSGGSPLSTKALEADEQKDVDPGDQPPPSVVSSSTRTEIFPAGGTLRLEIEGSPEPIYLGLNHREIVLGRRDPATGALPDVDLTPFAGYRMGVSRRHSQIRHSEEGHLDVFDLGSSNGTFLNGRRLEAHYPYRLRDGDKLALGQIVIRVYFEKPAVEAEAAPAAPAMRGTGTKPFGDDAVQAAAQPEAAKPAEAKPAAAAQPSVQEAAKPAKESAKPPEPAKPTTVMPGSVPSMQASPEASKPEEKAAQPPSPSASPASSTAPKQPETVKKPEAEQPKPVQSQPSAPAALPSSTVSKPAEAKPEAEKPKQAQPQDSAPKPTEAKPAPPQPSASAAPKPAEAKPEAEKPKPPPFILDEDGSVPSPTIAKPTTSNAGSGNTSPQSKAEEGDNKKEDKKESSSKPDSPPKSSE